MKVYPRLGAVVLFLLAALVVQSLTGSAIAAIAVLIAFLVIVIGFDAQT